ncbi:hypothetical protein Tco_1509176 [Tanacetum coccineum]
MNMRRKVDYGEVSDPKIQFPNEMKVFDVMQPITTQIIYTTPFNDAYIVLDIKQILDEPLSEFGDELLDIIVVDEEADCNPINDIKELSCIMKTNAEFEPC